MISLPTKRVTIVVRCRAWIRNSLAVLPPIGQAKGAEARASMRGHQEEGKTSDHHGLCKIGRHRLRNSKARPCPPFNTMEISLTAGFTVSLIKLH